MPRVDALLIRHLAQVHGLETAREWQRPPLLVLPDDGVEDLLRPSSWTMDLDHLPWDDVVLSVGRARRALPLVDREILGTLYRYAQAVDAPGEVARAALAATMMPVDRGDAWIRVRLLPLALAHLRVTSPWLSEVADELARQGMEEWLLVECWDSRTARGGVRVGPDGEADPEAYVRACVVALASETALDLPLWPDVALVHRGTLEQRHLYTGACRRRAHGIALCHLGRCVRARAEPACVAGVPILDQAARLAVGVLSVFADPPLYPVRRRCARPDRSDRARKTATCKPWLREDLDEVILVDPSRFEEVGHPSRTGGGEHSSPRLHTRRGHWRRLTEERRTWVRPCWVGSREWESRGTQYQLADYPARVAVARAAVGG